MIAQEYKDALLLFFLKVFIIKTTGFIQQHP